MGRHIAPAMTGARFGTLIAALLLSACGSDGDTKAARNAVVPPVSSVTVSGTLQHRDLTEASGVATSVTGANVFWSQNDSGHDAELFAYDSTGASLGATRVAGATNRDWEAIARGPCATGACLYVGDVGDNDARHPHVVLWRVAEPSPGDSLSAPADSLRIRYPDGPRDVEAMWVAPDTGLWLLTKRPLQGASAVLRPAQLYHVAPAAWSGNGGEPHMATLVDSLPIVPLASNNRSWITDAALSEPDAAGLRRLAVRTYRTLFIFAADGASGRPGTLLATCDVEVLRERLGEGLAWLPDGRLLFVAEGRGARLQTARCP